MSRYIQYEAFLFFQSIGIGIILVMGYDVLKAVRAVLPHHPIIISGEDYLYWLSAGLGIFGLVYRYNQGTIRFFLLLGYFLGAVFWYMTGSSIFRKILAGIFSIPVVFVKKTINGLLFFCKRGKIFVYNVMKSVSFGGNFRILRFKRGKRVEEVKKKGKQKENSE